MFLFYSSGVEEKYSYKISQFMDNLMRKPPLELEYSKGVFINSLNSHKPKRMRNSSSGQPFTRSGQRVGCGVVNFKTRKELLAASSYELRKKNYLENTILQLIYN